MAFEIENLPQHQTRRSIWGVEQTGYPNLSTIVKKSAKTFFFVAQIQLPQSFGARKGCIGHFPGTKGTQKKAGVRLTNTKQWHGCVLATLGPLWIHAGIRGKWGRSSSRTGTTGNNHLMAKRKKYCMLLPSSYATSFLHLELGRDPIALW